MKMYEILQQDMKVTSVNNQEVNMTDKDGNELKVKTDPKKPGKIATNDNGELELDMDSTGDVAPTVKPGAQVSVKSNTNKPGQPKPAPNQTGSIA